MKRILALLLSVFMVIAVAASCTKDETSKNDSAPTTEKTTQETTDKATEEKSEQIEETTVENFNSTGFPIVNDPITMSYLTVNWWNLSEEDYTTDVWLDEIAEKTNIRFEPVSIPSADAGTKRNLMLASGDYPEVIGVGFSRSEIVQFGVEDGILLDIKPYIDAYADELNKIFEYKESYYTNLIAPDGGIYGIPNIDEGYHTLAYPKIYIRQDWLDALNLEMPTDTESFREMLTAFVENDLNGNGEKDEIGIMGGIQSRTPVQWAILGQAFITCRPELWLYQDEQTKEIIFSPAQDDFQEGLRYIKSLYDEGLIDPTSFTQDNKQLQVSIRTEPYAVGAYVCDHVAMGVDPNNYDEYKNYQVLPVPIKGPNGFQEQPDNNGFGEVGSFAIAISDKAKHPEAAFRFIDYLMSEEQTMLKWFGKEGRDWEKLDQDSGVKNLFGEPVKYSKIVGYEGSGDEEVLAYHTLSTPFFKSLAVNNSAMAQPEDVYLPNFYEQRIMTDTISLQEYRKDVYLPRNIFIASEDSDEYNEILTNINDYINKATVQFITGELDIDADWDSYLVNLDKYGADRYVEIYSNAYNMFN